MSPKPPTRAMRENPDLNQLKRQAKELLEAYRASSPEAVAEVRVYHRTATLETFALHDAQFVLARAYGFESWPKLKAAADGVTAAKLKEAAETGDLHAARALLTRRPEIIHTKALLAAVLRRDLEMTRLLLEFQADPYAGVWPNQDATSPAVIARERGYDEIVDAIRAAREKRGGRLPTAPIEAMRKVEQAHQSGNEQAMVAVFDEYPELALTIRGDGVTTLHQAAGRGAPLLMKWLLDHGADVDAKAQLAPTHSATFLPDSAQGWTPLDFAAAGWEGEWLFDNGKFARTAKILLDHGARLTPLSAATLGRWDYLRKFSKQELEDKGVLQAAVKGNQPDTLRCLLDLGLDPDERLQIRHLPWQAWSAGGPLFQAVVLNHIEMARLLLERGANPNGDVLAAGSPAFRAYSSGNSDMIQLIEQHGGWIDPGEAGYARQTELARRMLAGEIDAHFEPNDFAGSTVAEQVLWGGASSLSVEIVRMALEHVDWAREDARWFGILFRPLHRSGDFSAQQKIEACECFRLIVARSGPDHRAAEYGQTILHQVVADDLGAGVELATILLDAGARLDVRDALLKSTPLGWACRWGRTEIVKLFLAHGADSVEGAAEPWATPRAWAEKKRHWQIVELLAKA